jgi:hypothetical protein
VCNGQQRLCQTDISRSPVLTRQEDVKDQLKVSIALILTLWLSVVSALPSYAQCNADEQEKSDARECDAAGQGDLPVVVVPPSDRSHVAQRNKIQQARPALQHQGPVPRVSTEEGRGAKGRANRGELDEVTTKPTLQ